MTIRSEFQPFDFATASDEERAAEAARREATRQAGVVKISTVGGATGTLVSVVGPELAAKKKAPRRSKQMNKTEPAGLGVFGSAVAAYGVSYPASEYVFAPPRKYRFDYAWPPQKVALEVEGGVFTRGAHGSISGILRDMQKYNLAAANGWRILRVLPNKLLTDATMKLVKQTLGA